MRNTVLYLIVFVHFPLFAQNVQRTKYKELNQVWSNYLVELNSLYQRNLQEETLLQKEYSEYKDWYQLFNWTELPFEKDSDYLIILKTDWVKLIQGNNSFCFTDDQVLSYDAGELHRVQNYHPLVKIIEDKSLYVLQTKQTLFHFKSPDLSLVKGKKARNILLNQLVDSVDKIRLNYINEFISIQNERKILSDFFLNQRNWNYLERRNHDEMLKQIYYYEFQIAVEIENKKKQGKKLKDFDTTLQKYYSPSTNWIQNYTEKLRDLNNTPNPNYTVSIDTSKFVIITENFNLTELPSFQAKAEDLKVYLRENIYYSDEMIENNVNGKVYVKCLILANGKIGEILILRNKTESSLAELETKRLLLKMPLWNPGKVAGKAVNSYAYFSIYFNIE